VNSALHNWIASLKGSLMPKAVVVSAWAYEEKARTNTKTTTAKYRPREGGIRPIIPWVQCCGAEAVGKWCVPPQHSPGEGGRTKLLGAAIPLKAAGTALHRRPEASGFSVPLIAKRTSALLITRPRGKTACL